MVWCAEVECSVGFEDLCLGVIPAGNSILAMAWYLCKYVVVVGPLPSMGMGRQMGGAGAHPFAVMRYHSVGASLEAGCFIP